MMIQKNLELQLQALEILQHRYGLMPKSFVADGALPPDENAILEQVLKWVVGVYCFGVVP